TGAVDLPDFGSDATTGELIELDFDRFREIAGSSDATMVGPLGTCAENWVPEGHSLPHEIRFAQPENTSLPTREIRIVTTLDEALDPRSFRLGGITLGDISIAVPAGRAVYQTDIDLAATRGFNLRTSMGIDVETSTATWLFQA